MISFKEYLVEAKRNSLYHGRSLKTAMIILKNNMLEGRTILDHPGMFKEHKMGISLSRDPNVAKKFGDVVFELDRNKLSHNYKLIPINWGDSTLSPHKSASSRQRVINGKKEWFTESEEFVIGSIRNLDKYLTCIWVPEEVYLNIDNPLFKNIKELK